MISATAARVSGLALAVRPAGPVERLQGQPRAVGASRAAGCGAPLGWRDPARTMRGVPAGDCDIFPDVPQERSCVGDGLAVVLAGVAAGYGGDRRRPVTGGAVRGSRRAVGLASEGRGESCRPATARPRVNPSRLRRVTLAAHPSRLLAPVLAVHGLRPSGPARRRCALEVVKRVVTTLHDSRCPIAVARARSLRISAGSWMPYAIRVPGTCGRR